MPTGLQYDVIIVGASVAGCTAAILLGRAGARVALIERDRDPEGYKKLCTHFIQASATPTLERLGLASAIEEAGGLRNDLEVFTRWGWIVAPSEQVIARPAHGYSIRRSKLDPMLRKAAAETPGVDFMPGFSVRDLLVQRGRVFGITAQGEGDERREIRAALVVGADGRQSRVAELAGLPAKQAPNARFGYFAHYRNVPLSRGAKSQFWFLEPDVAYTLPNDDGVTIVTAMPAKARLAEWKADPDAAMARLFENLPRAPSLAQAQRITPFMGLIEYPNLHRPKISKPGLALIGDAAQSLDPLWGVGCGWALQSAEWLADAVRGRWASPRGLDRAVSAYARLHRSRLAGHRFVIEYFSTGRAFNIIDRLTFSAATRDPACADALMAFASRCVGIGKFLGPRALARAIWVNVRHTIASKSATTEAAPLT